MVDESFTAESKINPVADPAWWHWSKGISQPKSDEAAKYGLEGAGEVAEGAAKVADFSLKQQKEADLQAQTDKEQKDMIQSLEIKSALVRGNNPVGAGIPDSTTGDQEGQALSF